MMDQLVAPRRERQLEAMAKRFRSEQWKLERRVRHAERRLEAARILGVHGPRRRLLVAKLHRVTADLVWCTTAIAMIAGDS